MNTCTKRSIGKLRKAPKTKPRSPVMTGKLACQKFTLETLVKQLREKGGDEIACNMAAWTNRDAQGDYLTIELSPLFEKRIPDEVQALTMEEFFQTLDEDD
jgi:hypothetical protein